MLCMKFPWPGILRTTWGDHERCRQTYFSSYPGHYFTGDGAKRDAEGRYRIIGRVDDVINVSGHRFGTAEIESAINLSEGVVESAVVGYPHDIKGQGIYAYVVTAEAPGPERQAGRGPHHAARSWNPWWPASAASPSRTRSSS
jgi:acetyl-CoA synthetase